MLQSSLACKGSVLSTQDDTSGDAHRVQKTLAVTIQSEFCRVQVGCFAPCMRVQGPPSGKAKKPEKKKDFLVLLLDFLDGRW